MTFTSYNQFMSDLYRGGVDFAAAHSKSLGFSGVEFLDFCGTAEPLNKEKYPAGAVLSALKANGLEVDCYSVYANLLAYESERTEREFYAIIDYAVSIGAKLFHHTLIPFLKLSDDMPKYEELFPKVMELERKIVKYCADRGLKCIFEPQGYYFNGVDGLSKLILTLREEFPDVGLCADLGNPVFVDCDPKDIIDSLSFCISHVHVKDYIISDVSLDRKGEYRSLGGKYLYEVLPADGILDIGACLKAIKTTGYDGCIALEYVGDDETIKNTMKYLNELLEK